MAVCLLLASSLSAHPAQAILLEVPAGSLLEIGFRHYGPHPADVFIVYAGTGFRYPAPTDREFTAELFAGSALVGIDSRQMTSTRTPRLAVFTSPDSVYTYANPTVIDFTSFQDGTLIAGSVRIAPVDDVAWRIETEELNLALREGRSSGVAIGVVGHVDPVIDFVRVVPEPSGTSAAALIIAAVVGIGVRGTTKR